MPRTRLHKSREVRRLIKALRKAAPELLFTARDRKSFYDRKRAKETPIWMLVRTLKDDDKHAAPIQPSLASRDDLGRTQKYTAQGESIPRKPKNKLADADLSDKPKR